MTPAEILELRAALIQLAKTLEIERGCILRILSVLDKHAPTAPNLVTILPSDSLVGYITKDN
jgi:hypothetical protein